MQLETVIDGEIEVGRQRADEPEPFERIENGRSRLIIASRKEANVSRAHIRLVPDPEGGLNVVNTSRNCSILVAPDRELLPGKTCFVTGRAQIHVQQITMVIEPLQDDLERTVSLGTPSQWHDATSALSNSLGERSLIQTLGSSFDAAQTETLLIWLRAIAMLFRHASDKSRFASESVAALQRILGSDSAEILQRHDSDAASTNPWSIVAAHGSNPSSPRTELLARMLHLKQSIFSESEDQMTVLTPVLNEAGQVTGAVAVTTRTSQLPHTISVTLQVGLLELIASGLQPLATRN